MKRYTGDHYSQAYFAKFRDHGSLKQRLLDFVDRKEPLFGALKKQFPRGSTLLDYGCGPGWFLAHAQAHFKTVGIDFSRQALIDAKKNSANSHLILGDESVLDELTPDAFDLITLFDVLEHVADPKPILSSLHRLLKRPGLLAISVPNGNSVLRIKRDTQWWGYADPSHLWFLSEQEWRIKLYDAGFTFVKRYPTGLINYPTAPYALSGTWLWFHYLTQTAALANIPLPNKLNDCLFMTFRKIE
jgi:SAM-dependent methyltransferase